MRHLGLLLICLLLCACGARSGVKREPSVTGALSFQQLRNELAQIPGAQVTEGEPLVVSFPVGTLFGAGAALPMPGGTVPLDALSALVKQSGLNWRIRVRAASGEGAAYDATLANTRARIIETYFTNAGINLRKISLNAGAEPGAPLELTLVQ